MKKFRFKLESVLKYRLEVKNEKKQVLALKNAELREAEDHLEQLLQEQLKNTTESCNYSEQLIHLVAMYGARLKAQIENQHLVIEEAQIAAELARKVYIEASREAQVLEKLKDKKKREYEIYVEREQGKFLDELAVQRAGMLGKE